MTKTIEMTQRELVRRVVFLAKRQRIAKSKLMQLMCDYDIATLHNMLLLENRK